MTVKCEYKIYIEEKMPSAKTYTRSQYEKSFDLLMKYERIVVRRADQDTRAFDELVAICDTVEKYTLLDELLSRFYYMDDEDYQNRVGQIADHIIRMKYDPWQWLTITRQTGRKMFLMYFKWL